jgi:HD-GYP domain-containing protein (c-di-GMP phosphodiesterase class II)
MKQGGVNHVMTRPRSGPGAEKVQRALLPLGRSGAALLALLLVAPAGVTLALRATPRLDLLFESPGFHVVVVSAIAACALVVALLTAVVASRAPQPATVLVACGCLFVGVMMLGHGLTTPGVFGRPLNMWVARFPVLALAGFALCLVGATLSDSNPAKRLAARYPRALLAGVAGVLLLVAGVVIADPTTLGGGGVLPGEEAISRSLAAASGVGLLVAGASRWRRWRLSSDRLELALVLACWLSFDAVISFQFGMLWRLSWWDYHAYLLAGFAAAAWAVVREVGRNRSVTDALATLSVTDPVQHLSRGHPEALHALTAAVEARDPYTHGHSARVAEVSAQIGLRVGMEPAALRRLCQGASLHDIGKIGVPDQVLNKPGSLMPEEWTLIRAHPVVGSDMAGKVPSLRGSLAVIRHHHERWDGSGYPDRMAGEDIPIPARIAAVADVWDALTSDRAYRAAWPPDKALAHIAAASGTLFDPLCVEAFVDLVAERSLWPERTTFDPEALLAAAERCHPRRPAGAEARHARA